MVIRIFFYKFFNIDLLAYIHEHDIISHLIGLSYGLGNFFIGLSSGELFTKFVSLVFKENTTHFLGISLGINRLKEGFFSFNLDPLKMKMGPSEYTHTKGIKEITPSNAYLKGPSDGNEGQSADLTEKNLKLHNLGFGPENSRAGSSPPSSCSSRKAYEICPWVSIIPENVQNLSDEEIKRLKYKYIEKQKYYADLPLREKEYEKLGHRFKALSTIFKDTVFGGIFQGKSQDILFLSKTKESESQRTLEQQTRSGWKVFFYKHLRPEINTPRVQTSIDALSSGATQCSIDTQSSGPVQSPKAESSAQDALAKNNERNSPNVSPSNSDVEYEGKGKSVKK